jgi:hypothetical protein
MGLIEERDENFEQNGILLKMHGYLNYILEDLKCMDFLHTPYSPTRNFMTKL